MLFLLAFPLERYHNKMSLKLPSFSKTKVSYQEFTRGLETFLWTDLSSICEIGRGSFGLVFLASLNDEAITTTEKVVVKKLLPSSRSDEKQRFGDSIRTEIVCDL